MIGGIYQIRHVDTGRVYVGSARNFQQRWHTHRSCLRRGTHHSPVLQNSWAKYGEAAFAFERLVICDASMLLVYEQTLIDAMQPRFNVSPIAGSRAGTKQSDATRSKIAASLRGRKLLESSTRQTILTRYENARRRVGKNPDMPRGVSLFDGRYYVARMNIDGKSRYLGSYRTAADASAAYEAAVAERMRG